MNLYPLFKSKYFYLLFSIIAYLIFSPLLIGNQISNFILSVLFSLIIIFCVNVISHDKKFAIISIVLGVIAFTTYWRMSMSDTYTIFFTIHNIVYITFLTLMIYYVASSISQHPRITTETLLGAISGYFLLGLAWTYVYLLINDINPHAFSDHTNVASMRDRVQHFIYFSFESLTTLGFGDILPLTDTARTFTWLEAAAGQIYLAVWISQLVGLRIAQLVKMETK